MRRAATVAGWVAVALAGACEQPRTELVVRVDSEVDWGPGPGRRVQSIVLTVRRAGADGPLRSARTTTLGADVGRQPLPLYVGVIAAGADTDTPVWVEALGCDDPNGCTTGTAVVVQRAVVRFVRGQTQELPLLLASACVGVTCASDQRCATSSGQCEAATRAQEMVRPFEGTVARAGDATVAMDVEAETGTVADSTLDTGSDMSVMMDIPGPVDRPVGMDALVVPDVSTATDNGTPVDEGLDAGRADVQRSDAAVPVGVYDFTSVRTGLLTSQPVAVAWHPSGTYALILAESDKVFRYTPADDSVTLAASLGSTIFWAAIAFTPDGAHAVLTASAFAAPRGRLFRWNHAESSVQSGGSGSAIDYYAAVSFRGDGTRGALLGQSVSDITLWNMNLDGTRGGMIASRPTLGFNPGCATVAWVTDAFGDPALAVGCPAQFGILAITELSGTAQINEVATATRTGVVSGLAARPQGDLALAIGSASGRLYRYFRGAWSVDPLAPTVTGATAVAFNDDGARAMVVGGYGNWGEYRFNLYAMSAITQSRIPLGEAPYNQPSDASATAVAWRPGCDEGIVIGGGRQSGGRPSAFIARFSVRNGRGCPP